MTSLYLEAVERFILELELLFSSEVGLEEEN